MSFGKMVVLLYVVAFFGFSVPAFFYPAWFSGVLGYDFLSAGSYMEFMGAYGGLIFGVGVFLCYCLMNSIGTGLVAILSIVGCLFLGRVAGFAVEKETNIVQNSFLFIELLTIVLVAVALRMENRVVKSCVQADNNSLHSAH